MQFAQQFRRYISASFFDRSSIVLRSFFVRSSIVLRSFSVRSPFVLRSSSVDPPFNLRSSSVRESRNERRTIEESSEAKRRCIDYTSVLKRRDSEAQKGNQRYGNLTKLKFFNASLRFSRGLALLPIYDLRYACPMKTAVRLGAISPITGCPIWCGGIR